MSGVSSYLWREQWKKIIQKSTWNCVSDSESGCPRFIILLHKIFKKKFSSLLNNHNPYITQNTKPVEGIPTSRSSNDVAVLTLLTMDDHACMPVVATSGDETQKMISHVLF